MVTGPGASKSAGVPDFGNPDTKFITFLEQFKLPTPESLFDLMYFEKNPQPFYSFAKEYLSVERSPTVCHYFLKLLEDKNMF